MMRRIIRTAGGTKGLEQKLSIIRRLVEAAKRQPEFRRLALPVLRSAPDRDFLGEIEAIVDWVREHLRYVKDPVGLETFQTPLLLLKQAWRGQAYGDCDDQVLLTAALLETAGHPVRYRVGGNPGWSHIWIEVRSPTGWLPLELTLPRDVGWDSGKKFSRTRTFPGGKMTTTIQQLPTPEGSRTEIIDYDEPAYYGMLPSDLIRANSVGFTGEDFALEGFGKSFRRFTKRARKAWKQASPYLSTYGPLAMNLVPGIGTIASMGLSMGTGLLSGGGLQSIAGGLLNSTGVGSLVGGVSQWLKPAMPFIDTALGVSGLQIPGLESFSSAGWGGNQWGLFGLEEDEEDLGAPPREALPYVAKNPKFGIGNWLWELRKQLTKKFGKPVFDPRPIMNLKVPDVTAQYHPSGDPMKGEKWFGYDWGKNPVFQPGANLLEAYGILLDESRKWQGKDPGFVERATGFLSILDRIFNQAFARQMAQAKALASKAIRKKMAEARKKALDQRKKMIEAARKQQQQRRRGGSGRPDLPGGPKYGPPAPPGVELARRYQQAIEAMRRQMQAASGAARKRYESRIAQLEAALRRLAARGGGGAPAPAAGGISPMVMAAGGALLLLALKK